MTLNEDQHHLNQYHSAEFGGAYDESSLKEIDLQLPTRKPEIKVVLFRVLFNITKVGTSCWMILNSDL